MGFLGSIDKCWSDFIWFLQKVFRKSHTSDLELWSLDFTLAKMILPKLRAFREMDRNGYPGNFVSDIAAGVNLGLTEEQVKADIESGELVLGGPEEWTNYLDEMIFSFEYQIYGDGSSKKSEKFYESWNLEDPWKTTGYDYKLLSQYEDRCQNGLMLFAKYFRYLWD